jgi:DtxR family Mn-dependent transcriptional regulator
MLNNVTLTRKERDCMVLIGGNASSDFPLRLVEVSSSLGIKPPTALNMVKKLVSKGMLLREHGMLALSAEGRDQYRKIIESHRVIETMISRYGVDIDTACRLSCNLDFIIDETTVNSIFRTLGKPKSCPHGNKIEVI